MGYIFAIYSVAVIIASPLVGMLIKTMGRRSLIFIGVLLMGTSFMFFGLADYVQDPLIFTLCLFIIRFLQGFSSALIQTTLYSVCTNFYPEDKEALVGYIEAITGVGMIAGPILGSTLYTIGGYEFAFYSFGGVFLILAMWVYKIFPEYIDKSTSPEEEHVS